MAIGHRSLLPVGKVKINIMTIFLYNCLKKMMFLTRDNTISCQKLPIGGFEFLVDSGVFDPCVPKGKVLCDVFLRSVDNWLTGDQCQSNCDRDRKQEHFSKPEICKRMILSGIPFEINLNKYIH